MRFNPRRLAFELLESRRVLSGGGVSASAATVFVNLPNNLTGQPGGQVVAPVNIDNAAGIRGAEIRINYDSTLLAADNDSVLAGSVWPRGSTAVVANVNQTAGSIMVFVFTTEGLNPGGGSLLEVHFAIRSEARVGNSTAVDLAKVRLNEGGIIPNPEPIPGLESTDGKITSVGAVNPAETATISGFASAQTVSQSVASLPAGLNQEPTSPAVTAKVHVDMRDDLTSQPGARVVEPVKIDNAGGILDAVVQSKSDAPPLNVSKLSVPHRFALAARKRQRHCRCARIRLRQHW